ncbi:MAG: glycosyltransferase family 8 protein, partial [Armatimonadota bacterium]
MASVDTGEEFDPGKLIVACGGDNNYAMPVAVTLFSLIESQPDEVEITCYLLSGGMTFSNKQNIERVLRKVRHNLNIEWLEFDLSQFTGMHRSAHLTEATLMRLLLPEKLPQIKRLLYIDCDVLVRGDVRPFYQHPFNDTYIVGVQDFYIPTTGIYGHTDLNIDPDLPYFNAGVMMMNLDLLRKADLIDPMLRLLRKYPEFHDQDGLNALIGGRWQHTNYKWNLQIGWRGLDTLPPSDVKSQLIADREHLFENAQIIHFNTSHKPWKSGLLDPFRPLYHSALQRSEWFTPSQYRR